MLNAWFYSHSVFAVAVVVCFVTAAIPLIGLHFFHKIVPWNVREEDTSMVGLSYALCGGIFAVVGNRFLWPIWEPARLREELQLHYQIPC